MNRTIPLLSAALLALFLLAGCDGNDNGLFDRLIRGSGTVLVENRPVGEFQHITFLGQGQLNIEQGPATRLTVETDDNLLPLIVTAVRGDTLYIELSEEAQDKLLDPTDGITFTIATPTLRELTLSGAGRVDMGELETDSLAITLSGAVDLDVGDLQADSLTVLISGAGDVTVAGDVDQESVTLSGAGNFDGDSLKAESASVAVTGAGRARVWVTESLDARISGLGDIEYFGSPTVTQDVSGLGRVVQRGARN